MEYKLQIHDNVSLVRANTSEGDGIEVSIGEASYRVACTQVSPHHLALTINGAAVNAFVNDAGGVTSVIIEGIVHSVQDVGAAPSQGRKKRSQKDIPLEITPPMPSVVVRILVNEGDTVTKGQGIIVVSAMKLETTLYAPFDGTVKSINVSVGEKVMPGRILVDIEKGQEQA